MDPSRDLDAVANLIETAFELKNDPPEGMNVVHNMRQHARMLASADATFLDNLSVKASYSNGLVWEDQGQVVGNITLIPPHADGFRRVIMIANVSVQDDYRRKGIARELTIKALRHCRSLGVRDVSCKFATTTRAPFSFTAIWAFTFYIA